MTIAFGRSGAFSNTGVSPLTDTVTLNAGETAVVHTTLNPTSLAVTNITDNAGGGSSTYTKVTQAVQGTNVKTEGWRTDAGGAKAATTESMAFSGSNSDSGLIVGAYTGVLAIGSSATTAGTGANPAIGLLTTGPNSWVVAGFGIISGSLPTAGTGNLRQTDADVSIVQALVDNTAASASTVTCSITLGSLTGWAAWAIELKSVPNTQVFYLNNPIQGGSNAGLLDTTAPTASTSTTGWTVGTTGVNQYSRQTYNSEVGAGNFTSTAQPSGTLVNLGEDCFRISAATSGTFSAGTWYSSMSVLAVSSGGIQQGRGRFRLWASSNADGSSARELTQGIMVGSIVTELNTSVAQTSSASTQMSAVTLTNEFLFQQQAWETL